MFRSLMDLRNRLSPSIQSPFYSPLLFHQQGANAVHDSPDFRGWAVVVIGQDRKGDPASVGASGIAGKRAHVGNRAGLGVNAAGGGAVAETRAERPVPAGDG